MAFDSKDTAAFKGVWVFCEQREGVIMSTSYQLLSEGRKLANDLGVELCGVVPVSYTHLTLPTIA